MAWNTSPIWKHLRRQGVAYLVMIITLIPTGVAYFRIKKNLDEQHQLQFDQEARTVQETIDWRFQDCVSELVGLHGFYTASDAVTRIEWQQFIRGTDLQRRFPGVDAVGFAERVEARQMAAHIQKIRKQGVAGYDVDTSEARDVYHPVIFLSQFTPRLGESLGMELAQSESARQAMRQAADLGKAILAPRSKAGSVTQTNTDPGFVIYMPVYQRGAKMDSPENRRAALQGYIYGSFAVERMLREMLSISGQLHIHIELYDGLDLEPSRLLFSTRPHQSFNTTDKSSFIHIGSIRVLNRVWSMRVVMAPELADAAHKNLPWLGLAGGLTITFLLFGIVWLQSKARFTAENLSAELRKEQERHHLVERATHDAVWEWELASNAITWNEAAQEMFRYPAAKMIQHRDWWCERVHPEDRVRIIEGMEASLRGQGEFWADEYRFLRGDNTYAEIIDRGYILRDANGKPVRVMGSAMDITGRRQAEEARRHSEQRMTLHVQQTPLAVIEWNLNFEVKEWNAAAERIFGYSAEEAVGRNGVDLIVPPSARPHVDRIWQELISPDTAGLPLEERYGSAGRRSTNENLTKDGRTIVCDWYNTPLVDATGQVIGVASLASDITERVRAEKDLAAEKERLAVTLRSIGDGVITTDTHGVINLINNVAEELTGWRHGTALGRPLKEVFHVVHQKTRLAGEDPVARVLQTGRIVAMSSHSVLLRPGGLERLIASSAAPILDKDGVAIGAVLVFRDMTEQQMMADELLRASKLDSLALLAGGIAHDFNNILTAIIGNLSLARLYAKPEDKILPRLEEAEKASMRAKDLTLQLLTFAKGGTPVKQVASIKDLIHDSAQFASRGTSVRCEFALAEDLWPVEVDEGQVSQVINNLAINATQAMPQGGVVRISAENLQIGPELGLPLPEGRYISITIKDRGIGIPAEHLAKIFDPYFTTKQKGSGLGLATSYSIIKKHDGLLTVESELGVGSTFHVYLPASDRPVRPAPVAPLEPLRGHGRILVMDDEPLIRELAETALQELGYDVESVEDGAAAIRRYEEERAAGKSFTVVIMDLTIPGGLGGKEAIKKLREIDPQVKAIVSSGYSNDQVMAHYREHGFSGMVGKPYKVEELAKVLSEVIQAPVA